MSDTPHGSTPRDPFEGESRAELHNRALREAAKRGTLHRALAVLCAPLIGRLSRPGGESPRRLKGSTLGEKLAIASADQPDDPKGGGS